MPEWGETVEENGVRRKHYPCHRFQWEVLTATERFTAAIAGTGGGKTVTGPLWLAREIARIGQERDLETQPYKCMVVAPTYPILSRATAPELVRSFRGTALEGKYIESRNVYILPNEMGLIYTLSADNPQGLEGGQIDSVWIDEGGQITYTAWIALQGRLGAKQGRALITTTPYGENWLFHRFWKKWKQKDPNYRVVTFSSIANPVYPQEEYERARREMSPQRFSMRYDGEFIRMAGLVFPNWRSCVKQFIEVPQGTNYGGGDWGWSPSPFAALAAVLDSEDRLYVWYNRSVRNVSVVDHAKKLPVGVHYFFDPANPEGIETLRRAGHTVEAARVKSKIIGLDAVYARMATGRLIIHPKCRALLKELSAYRYPEEDDEVKAKEPIGEHHSIDSLRYMISSIDSLSFAEVA
jgi:hypothetical protein